MDNRNETPLAVRQRGDRADRIVAAGAFLAFLVTGVVGDEPPPERQPTAAARTAHHAPR
jgi:hypothetical protein